MHLKSHYYNQANIVKQLVYCIAVLQYIYYNYNDFMQYQQVKVIIWKQQTFDDLYKARGTVCII
jgi:hypothetical protein